MLNVAPVVLVKNESIWIERVLRPLVAVFGLAIVGDTGSTDETRDLARGVAGVELLELGPMTPPELGEARRTLGRRALGLGRHWMLQVDGDELYHVDALRHIAETELPAGKRLGFTTMLSLDPDPDGSLWEMEDLFSRAAVMEAGVAWAGEYPFESPVSFGQPAGFFYYDLPPGLRYHALHLHRLQRSPDDDGVMFRKQKQHQFSMVDRTVARAGRFEPAGWW